MVGVLDGVALTLVAGNYCGRNCSDAKNPSGSKPQGRLRTDGTVPGSVYIPPGMLPENVVRKTFPTLHSAFVAAQLGLPVTLSVANDPAASAFVNSTTLGAWQSAGVPLLKGVSADVK